MNTNDDLAEALQLLPHGPEFRFIERIVTLDPGVSGSAEYTVRGDEPFLRGHFPGEPIFPGVLLIEAVAQLAGVIVQTDSSVTPSSQLRLTGVRGAKIIGTARPGETLRLDVRLLARLNNLVQAEGKILLCGRQILQCEITLSGELPA
jgi:3-hydroxyacyl-[acyl-carrier-protein] dehydratase